MINLHFPTCIKYPDTLHFEDPRTLHRYRRQLLIKLGWSWADTTPSFHPPTCNILYRVRIQGLQV